MCVVYLFVSAVSCPGVTVANSDYASSAATGNTTDTVLVSCDHGYATSGGDTEFNISCTGSGVGVSSFAGVESCEGETIRHAVRLVLH